MSSRWLDETGGQSGAEYEQRFRELAASGADVHGEAAFVQRLLPAGSSVLDAGCGTGRVARELARRGFAVVGVDSDPSMLAVARQAAQELRWVKGDLARLDLPEQVDAAVLAGNVMVFLAAGTEQEVLRRVAAHVRPGGLVVSGWRTDRMSREEYDALAAGAGLGQVARYATWEGAPWRDDAEWCVAVDRVTGATG
jgi:SAM-dependent methyltransferase